LAGDSDLPTDAMSPSPLAVAPPSDAPTVTVRTAAGEWTNAFALQAKTPGGPLVRVAFDPQPEPPVATTVNLASATQARFSTATTAAAFRTLVSVSREGKILSLDPAVFDQAKGTVRLVARDATGRPAYQITLTVRDAASPNVAPGSLVGLNPQPLPPGDAGAAAFGFGGTFAAAARATLTVTIADMRNKAIALSLRPNVPLKADQTVPIFFTLSRDSRTFSAGDVVISGGTLSNFYGSGDTYSALFTPAPDSVTPGQIEIPAGAFADFYGNVSLAGGLARSFAIDTRLPTVTVTTAPKGTSPDRPLGIGGSMPLVFTLSEPVTGFTAEDVQVTGGRLVDFAGRGTTFKARFVPDSASTTAGRISIPAGAFFDLAGNANAAGGLVAPIPVDSRPTRLTVSRDVATIQEAVSKVADGGTVFLPPGVYDVATNPITIAGKIVNVVGLAGSGKAAARPVIRGNDTPRPAASLAGAVGLINYGPGGGGRLENLTLQGGDAGVRGFVERTTPPQGVSVNKVSFIKNGRGLAGEFQQLSVTNCSITEAYSHGASLAFDTFAPNANVSFVNNTVGNCGEFGLRIVSYRTVNNPLSIVLNKTTIVGNGGGGAVLIGPMNVQTLESKFLDNAQVGFWCSDIATTNNLFFKSIVSGGKPGVGAVNELGHGLVLANSGSLTVTLSQFSGNAFHGVLAHGPVSMALNTSTVTNNKFGLVYVLGAQVTYSTSTISENTEEDIMSDNELPTPGPPNLPTE
jgi:hypothetical protein